MCPKVRQQQTSHHSMHGFWHVTFPAWHSDSSRDFYAKYIHGHSQKGYDTSTVKPYATNTGHSMQRTTLYKARYHRHHETHFPWAARSVPEAAIPNFRLPHTQSLLYTL